MSELLAQPASNNEGPQGSMNTNTQSPTHSALLSLPAELRLTVYKYLPVPTLLALNTCNKSLHGDILPYLSQHATLQIRRREKVRGKSSYTDALQRLDHLMSTTNLPIQNVILHAPYACGKKLKTLPDALQAFDNVLERLKGIDIKCLSVAISLPDYSTFSDEDFGSLCERITTLLPDPEQLFRPTTLLPDAEQPRPFGCNRLVLCCTNLTNNACFERWVGLIELIEACLLFNTTLDVLEVWVRWPEIRSRGRRSRILGMFLGHLDEGDWCERLVEVQRYCEVRIAYYDDRQDLWAQSPVCSAPAI